MERGRGYSPFRGGGRFQNRGRGGRFGGRTNQSNYQSEFLNTTNYNNNNSKNNKRTREVNNTEMLNSINQSHNNDNTLAYITLLPQEVGEAEEEEDNKLQVGTLFDSGATRANYINLETANRLEMRGAIRYHDLKNNIVCSGIIGTSCTKAHGYMNINIAFTDENSSAHRYLIRVNIIDHQHELILGRQTIKDLNITDLFPSHFKNINDSKESNDKTQRMTVEEETGSDVTCPECTPVKGQPKLDSTSVDSLHVIAQTEIIRTLTREDRDEDGIDENELTVFPYNNFQKEQTMPNLYGSQEFKNELTQLCNEFSAQFATTINKEPARVPPMRIEVEKELWQRNNYPARPMNAVKMESLRGHIDNLTSHNIIQPSTATAWSQVHLANKPDGTYRFTCDFRDLNNATIPRNNHVPNIEEMLQRIGHKNAKIFGTLDLTHGYWQVKLEEESRKFTAFICCFGVFEFLRLAMGIKNASGHFQSMLTAHVLVGLIWMICELYIDDLLIYASNEGEFLTNVRQVLTRFRQFNLVCNPKKCHLGMPEAEFVGKLIDSEGVSFSKKRLSEIDDIKLPRTANELKKFIGLLNYFRHHIRNAHEISSPLMDMIPDYDKRKHRVLQWDDDKIAAFERAKAAIIACPRLYFWIPGRQTILCTDASDRGVGGYLFQIEVDDDGTVREFPIGFTSKGFTKQQQRWGTPDKEAFGVYYCVKKFDHILRDITFTIKTDHKNLLYLDKDPQAKIRRYKLALQEYDCTWEHIDTHSNVVADDLSRLCSPQDIKSYTENEIEWLNTLLDEFQIPDDIHNLISQVHNSTVGHLGVEKSTQRVERLLDDDDIYKETREILLAEIETARQKDPHGKTNDQRYIKMRRNIMKRDKNIDKIMTRLKASEDITLHRTNIRRYVRKFIQQCPCCQKMSQIKVPIHTKPFTTASHFPMERLNVDTIGPLKEDERGNRYIIAIIDSFTRWIGLYAVRDVTAECAVDALIEHFGIFGCPAQLLSDNGSQFVNELIKEFTKLIGTEHITTMAYSKEENGMVERSNKETMRHLRNLIFEFKDTTKWTRYAKLVQRILNATVHESIGVSPAQLLFGNAIDLDRGLFTPLQDHMIESDIPTAISEWAMEMIKIQSELLLQAREAQEKRDTHNIARRTPMNVTEFSIHSYVLIGYPKTSHHSGPPSKFHTNLKGPYQVVAKSGTRYTVRNLVTNKLEDFHITLLREFLFDPEYVDPVKIAMCDEQFYEIEKVLAHKGQFNKKDTLFFKVKWLGYDDEKDNTWEPWKNLRLNIRLHQYLRDKNLTTHIPKEYR